ncbi:MAG: hypothetical protein LBT14_04175 [Treponema sp.]|nr:hypothetical protein [Treponema sp.]
MIDKQDQECWADAGYVGAEIEEDILKKNPDIVLHINEKGYRNHTGVGKMKTGADTAATSPC